MTADEKVFAFLLLLATLPFWQSFFRRVRWYLQRRKETGDDG